MPLYVGHRVQEPRDSPAGQRLGPPTDQVAPPRRPHAHSPLLPVPAPVCNTSWLRALIRAASILDPLTQRHPGELSATTEVLEPCCPRGSTRVAVRALKRGWRNRGTELSVSVTFNDLNVNGHTQRVWHDGPFDPGPCLVHLCLSAPRSCLAGADPPGTGACFTALFPAICWVLRPKREVEASLPSACVH